MPVALSDGLDIKLGTSVTDIVYGGPGVIVKAVNPRAPSQQQIYKGKKKTFNYIHWQWNL